MGTFLVTLTVTDALGDTDFATVTIDVTAPLFVDPAAVGTGNGSSWTDAYTAIQAAVA